MAHQWADWVPHFCRMGVPQRFTAGDKITRGPQRGGLATSPLPYGGSPTLQKGGQNQKWPTNGWIGYITPAAWGVRNPLEPAKTPEVAHMGADWLHHPCRMGRPQHFRAGDNTKRGPQVGRLAASPMPNGGFPMLQRGEKITSGPQMGGLASSPLPHGASPTL